MLDWRPFQSRLTCIHLKMYPLIILILIVASAQSTPESMNYESGKLCSRFGANQLQLLPSKQDLEATINADRNLVFELRDILSKITRMHRDCNIAKTTGSSVSFLGWGAIVGGIFLAPVTAGWSLGLTIGGVVATTSGTITSVGTEITCAVKTQNLASKLDEVTNERLKVYHEVIASFSEVFKCFTLVGGTLVPTGLKTLLVIDASKMVRWMIIHSKKTGAFDLGSMFMSSANLDSIVRKTINKALSKLGVKVGAKTFYIVLGGALAAYDAYTLIESWTTKPELAKHLEEIIEELEQTIEDSERLQ